MRRRTDPLARAATCTTLLAGVLWLASVPASAAQTAAPADDPHVAAARRALSEMPLAERASQLITTSVPGTVLGTRSRETLRALRPGGVILFRNNYRSRSQLSRMVRSMQGAVRAGGAGRPRALMSIDQEGGVVRRISDAPPTRSHPQLGRADLPAWTRTQARRTAIALAGMGIHLDLAPVADLDVGPRRVMRERSFGSSPRRVGDHVVAFVDGLQEGGGAAAVKHFPGFGGALVNSDDALAAVSRSRLQLRSDLVPFRRAVRAGTDAVMVSHGVYAAIDRGRPASTSPAVYRLLRRDLGYRGVAITDSLHAAGFTAATRRSVVDGCVATVAAGADIALLTGTLRDAVVCRGRLVAAVRGGSLSRARVDAAALRVLTLKSRLGLLSPVSSSPPAG